jgi:hypothetical protein
MSWRNAVSCPTRADHNWLRANDLPNSLYICSRCFYERHDSIDSAGKVTFSIVTRPTNDWKTALQDDGRVL